MQDVPAVVPEKEGCCEAAASAFFFWSFWRLASRAFYSLPLSFSRSFSSSWRKLGENISSTRAK